MVFLDCRRHGHFMVGALSKPHYILSKVHATDRLVPFHNTYVWFSKLITWKNINELLKLVHCTIVGSDVKASVVELVA